MSMGKLALLVVSAAVLFFILWKLIVAFVWLMLVAVVVVVLIMLGISAAGAWDWFKR